MRLRRDQQQLEWRAATQHDAVPVSAETSAAGAAEEPVLALDVHQGGLQRPSGGDGAAASRREVDTTSASIIEWTPTTFGAIGACVAATIIVLIAAIFWVRHRRRHQKLLHDLTFDENMDMKTVKSAPASRTPSPRMSKRLSCPDALSMNQGLAVRSGRIPDFTLPPERVQPHGHPDSRPPGGSAMAIQPRKNSLGTVRPELYHSQSFSEEDEPHLPETPNGRLWFSLHYDDAMEQLHVTLIKVKDLPGRVDSNQLRDPFVKIFLLPDERTSKTSKSKKKTLSPVYNETHSFPVTSDDVHNRVIRFSVYDLDKRRLLHSLGHVMINLRRLDLQKGDVMWSDLEPMAQAASSQGEIQLSLAFYPQNDKIRMGIHRARNLQDLADRKDLVSYVRVQLYYGHKSHRVKSTRTTHQRFSSTEHSFNEVLSFTVHGKQLEQCHLTVVLVVTSPDGSSDQEVGRVAIGPFMYARGDQLMHWQEMMAKPRVVSTHWHTLTALNNQGSP